MKLSVVSAEGNRVHVCCEGDFFPNPRDISCDLLAETVGAGCYGSHVLLNLEQVSMMDSSGVGFLLRCHRSFQQGGGKLVLHSVPPLVSQVFRLLRINAILNIAADEQAALQLLGGERVLKGEPE